MTDRRFVATLVTVASVALAAIIGAVNCGERRMREQGAIRCQRLADACRLRLSVAASAVDSAAALDIIPATDYIGSPRCSYWIITYPAPDGEGGT